MGKLPKVSCVGYTTVGIFKEEDLFLDFKGEVQGVRDGQIVYPDWGHTQASIVLGYNEHTGEFLVNLKGYSTVGFFKAEDLFLP